MACVHALADGREVSHRELEADHRDVRGGVHTICDVHDIAGFEYAHDLCDRIDLANVREELVPEPFSFVRASDEPGDIHEFDGRRDDLRGL